MQKAISLLFLAVLTSCAERTEVASPAKTLETTAQKQVPVTEEATKVEPSPKLIDGQYRVKSTQKGKMSWYSVKTNGGTTTASGKRFSDSGATAAHRTLRFGTKVRVTNLSNGRSEIITITDRGPFIKGRIIDVSIGTARKLGFVKAGVVSCKVEVLTKAS